MNLRRSISILNRRLRNMMLLSIILFSSCVPLIAQTRLNFNCARTKVSTDNIQLTSSTIYNGTSSLYGFDLDTMPTSFHRGSCSSAQPFFFSTAAKDGNYQVTLVLGGPRASTTTVRAESRRLFVDQTKLKPGQSRRVVFNVNVRTPAISLAGEQQSSAPFPQVKLKPREIGALDWDNKLTLEFNGDHPSVRSISIQPIDSVPTIYIAGDSTVVDQTKEPWAAWGQMLPLFFDSSISIANEAESGETIRSFVGERRFDKVMSTIRPGDYLMIQFGHNDQKPGKGYVPAATDFKTYLLRYISEARAHGATPILVTPMNRRNFDSNGKIVQTLGDYPEAMREVAAEQKVALIDLNAISKTIFEAMGEAGTLHAFVHYPPNSFPDQPDELKDNTHFNSYGAYELARAIVQNIRDQKLPLARYLDLPIPRFDPAHPDPFSKWQLPPSPSSSAATPYAR
ncbi:MAG TPA: rhamnogalacturonan acetylesterase [Acidobacteriaceae bacterium]